MYDFTVGIGEWWSDSKIKLSKAGNSMKIQGTEVGASYQPFGVNFAGLDFSNVPVVRVSC